MECPAQIGILNEDGTVSSINCVLYGNYGSEHEEGVGYILENEYQDRNKVEELVSYGDRSCLTEDPKECLTMPLWPGVVSNSVREFLSLDRVLDADIAPEHFYLFNRDGKWLYDQEISELGLL